MLLPKDIAPEDCVYYNGALVMEIMLKSKKMKLSDLFVEMKERIDISFATLLLCLDWLYLIDTVKLNGEEVELCS